MSLLVNLRQLEKADFRLQGVLPASELDLEGVDEMIRFGETLVYDLEAQKMEKSVLVHGRLALDLECECVRCLKAFTRRLKLPDWACHLPLEGDERASVANDCVDLTPYIREDILLELPQHPVCEPDCGGLPKKLTGKAKQRGTARQTKEMSSAWTALNKLKFK